MWEAPSEQMDASRVGGDAVVMWLVRNMLERTDNNSFLMSHFFVLGQPDLLRLLGKGGAANTFARMQALHYWQEGVYLQDFVETARRFLAPGNFRSRSTTFAVQDMAQALYYIHYFAPNSLPDDCVRCHEVLRSKLVPRLHEFICCSVRCRDPAIPQDSKLSVALAVVNTVTLFMRLMGLLSRHDLQQVLALFQQLYMEEDIGELDLFGKTSVLAHIVLNVRGQCEFVHVAWIFEYLDSVQPQLQMAFEDESDPRRTIALDLIAEVLTGYRYFNHWTPSRVSYESFVAFEIRRKYAERVDHVYRFYAHADFPSDHEALSLYHMMMSGNGDLPIVRGGARRRADNGVAQVTRGSCSDNQQTVSLSEQSTATYAGTKSDLSEPI